MVVKAIYVRYAVTTHYKLNKGDGRLYDNVKRYFFFVSGFCGDVVRRVFGNARWNCLLDMYCRGKWLRKNDTAQIDSGMPVPLSGSIKCGSAVYCAQNSTELPDNAYALFWDADNETRRFFHCSVLRRNSLTAGKHFRAEKNSVLRLLPPAFRTEPS